MKSSVQASSSIGSDMPQAGEKAPEFELMNDEGKRFRLADFKGRKVVLFFYPEDDTPTCTKQACLFRDGMDEISKRGAIVLGVSRDSVASHVKFKAKYKLNFPLLSDADLSTLQAYGVWKEKSMFGRKYMGTERTTFIIDENGRIAKIFPKVRVKKHVQEVLAAL